MDERGAVRIQEFSGSPRPLAWSHPWAETLSVHGSLSGKEQGDKHPPTPCLPSICILSIILLLLAMWVHVWICACGYVHASAGVQAVSPWSWTCWEPGPLDEQHGLLDFYILFI